MSTRLARILRPLTAAVLAAAVLSAPSSTPARALQPADLSASLPAVLPTPPLPVTKDEYVTRTWVENVPTWFSEPYSYSIPWTERYDTYSTTARTVTVFVSKARFLFDALLWTTTAKNTALDNLRTAVNSGLTSAYASDPNTYSFNVAFVGMTDPRCTNSNYDGNPPGVPPDGEPNLFKYVSDPCKVLTSAQALAYGFDPNTPGHEVATGYTGASKWAGRGYTTFASGMLGKYRAGDVRDKLQARFDAKQPGVWAKSVDPYVDVISVGDWFAYHTAAECNISIPTCAEERRAEVVVWYSYTAYDTTVCSLCGSRDGTTIVTENKNVLREVPTVFQEQVNCTYYGTCLPSTPGFTSSPVVQVPPYMQPNRTHTFSLTPVAVSCTSCVTPPSAGPAKSGWGQPSVSNVTFSGFSAASIKSPSGYTSPTYWEVKGYPNGTGNQNQSFQVAFKKATRAGEVYTLKPGSVTITVTYTPWLWDGSSLTWLPDRATAETKTFPVSCRYTATGSTSCSFKVLGTGIVG